METKEVYKKAEERARAKLGFYIHLAVYLAVNTLLLVINVSTSTHDLWFKWPLIGWGIGVFFHGMGIFVFPEKPGLVERMIENEMRNRRNKA